jgi:hypothetical protein
MVEKETLLSFLIKVRDNDISPTSGTSIEDMALLRFSRDNQLIYKRTPNTYSLTKDGYKAIKLDGDISFIYDSDPKVKIDNHGIIGQANGSSFNNSFTKETTKETVAYNNAPANKPFSKTVKWLMNKIVEIIIAIIVMSTIYYFAKRLGIDDYVKF